MNQPARVGSIEKGGTQFVPFRTIVEQLGGNIQWDNRSKTATFSVKDVSGQVSANNRTLTAMGAMHSLSAEPFVEDGVLYVPIDALKDVGLTTG